MRLRRLADCGETSPAYGRAAQGQELQLYRAIAAAVLIVALAGCTPPGERGADPTASAPVTVGAITVEQAVARPPLGGQTTGVGYLVIRNRGDTADRLVAATSPAAAIVELHTHSRADGVMRMERVEGVDVPAHGEAVFEPRGLHLMLFDFTPGGATAPVTLRFEMAGEATVNFVVASR